MTGRGWFTGARSERLLLASAGFLIACGVFAIAQTTTGHLLPHDAAYLGMSAHDLCALYECRVVHFMVHDRVSFGGVLIAIGVMYVWLTCVPLRRGEAWAWWVLAASGCTGFLSFLSYLGYGYFDVGHALGTIVLFPLFVAGLASAPSCRPANVRRNRFPCHARAALGRRLLLLASAGIALAGLAISIVGMTTVFVPQDVAFMGVTREALARANRRLVPLIAHDRAAFGGGLVSFGIAMFGCVWYSVPSRSLLEALSVAGTAGFGAAVGIHLAIGYTDALHLGPAALGCVVYATGLFLAASGHARSEEFRNTL